MSLSRTISEILVENRRLKLPHLDLTPLLAVTPLEFRRVFRHRKTGVPGLSYSVVCMILRLVVLVQCWAGNKDGWTDDSIYRSSIALRGKSGSHDLNRPHLRMF